MLAVDVVEKQFRGDPRTVAIVMTDLAGQLFESGDLVGPLILTARASDIARAAGEYDLETAISCTRSLELFRAQLFDSARVAVADGRAALARTTATDNYTCLQADANMALVDGDGAKAISLLERALRVFDDGERSEGASKRSLNRLAILNDLARVIQQSGRPRDALAYQRMIVAAVDSMGYKGTIFLPNVASPMSRMFFELGELQDGTVTFRSIVRRAELQSGANNVLPYLASLHGTMLIRAGQADSASQWLARATVGPLDPNSMNMAQLNAVWADLEGGRVTEARARIAGVGAMYPWHWLIREWMRQRLVRQSGDSVTSTTRLAFAIDSIEAEPSMPRVFLTLPLLTLAEWHLASGDVQRADSAASRARTVAMVDSLAASRSGLVGHADFVHARVQRAAGKRVEATRTAQEAVIALTSGYGAAHPLAISARTLLDELRMAR